MAVARFARQKRRLVLVLAASSVLMTTLLVGSARSAGRASPLIAFTRPDGVYVMHADGSGVHVLKRSGFWTSWVTWSPDGRKLAYVAQGGLWVMNADGTGAHRLIKVSFFPSRPTWSPDCRKIALVGIGAIWIVNADGSDRRLLARPSLPLGVAAVDWRPTSGLIAISTGGWTVPGSDIYVMNSNGRGLHNLMPERTFAGSSQPDWSPDGNRIAYTHAAPVGGSEILEPQDEEICVMDAHGHSRICLTQNRVPDYDPAWSSDGHRLAFVRAAAGAGSGEIYVIDADGAGSIRLTRNHVSEASPSWQPVAR